MSENTALKEFLTKIIADPELMAQFKDAADKGLTDAYEFAKNHSEGEFTEKEFANYMKEITKACAQATSQLDENSLENVSGGGLEGGITEFDRKLAEGIPELENLYKSIDSGEAKLKAEKRRGRNWERRIDAAGAGTKLAGTLANIGFSLFKFINERKHRTDNKEELELEELKEQLNIGRLEKELAAKGINYDDIM